MSDRLTHKQGDTFDLSGTVDVTLLDQPVLNLTGWTGCSQIRTPAGALVANLVFTWLDASARLVRLSKPAADTQNWALGPVLIDIELTSPTGDVVSTPTATITIEKDNTLA